MAKKDTPRGSRAVEDRDDDDGIVLAGSTAAPRKSAKMVSAVVSPGNNLIVGETDDEGNLREVLYRSGDQVEISEDEIKARPWAFEEPGARKRSGQTTRLQKRVKDLEAEIARLKSAEKGRKASEKKADENHEAAVESIMARGDNFIGRGEPQAGAIPAADLDAFEEARDRAAVGDTLSLDDETGMHGIGREVAAGPTTGGGAAGRPSIPSAPEPGQSVRPGTGEPSSGQ